MMPVKSFCAIISIVGVLPSTAWSFTLIDIGLFNGTRHRLQLLIDYSSGRRIDWTLASGKFILMTRGFGEHITRVTVAGTRQAYDVAALREITLGKRRDLWLYFSADRIRVITGDEKRALEHAPSRPNQAMQRTASQPAIHLLCG